MMSLLVISMGVEVMPEGHVGYMQIIFGFGFWEILYLVPVSHSSFLEKLVMSVSRLGPNLSSNVLRVTLQNGTRRGLVKLSF